MKVFNQAGTNVKTFVIGLIEKKEANWLDRFLLRGLFFASVVFEKIIKLRRRLNNNKVIHRKSPIATVCVGNIVAGGSGKTPTVIKLAQLLSKNYQVAVISKGYLGTKVKKNKVSELKSSDSSIFFGDEPVMIKAKCPLASVFVSKNRNLALDAASEKGCDVALFDDGFQDLSFHADINIVMIKSVEPIRKGHFLPRGYLRDDPDQLQKADYIGLSQALSENSFKFLEKYLESFTSAPKFGIRPHNFIIKGKTELKLEKINKVNVGVFSAIAHPSSFEKNVLELGAKIVSRYHILDHIAFRKRPLEQFIESCKDKGVKYILCTLKDYVKLPKDLQPSLPIFYLDYSTTPSYQKEVFNSLLEDVETVVKDYKIKREISL